jgi:DNA-binding transcriptional ArsR family regulator
MNSDARAPARESTRAAGSDRETAGSARGAPGDASGVERRVLEGSDPADAALLELLGDEYTRRLLEALSGEPLGASALVERVEMSRATVYRRLDRLREHGLVTTDVAVSPDGNHHEVFEVTLERVTVAIADGVPTARLELRDAGDARGRPTVPGSAD